jgi:hypothetical protein
MSSLDRLINLAKRTGDRLIIHDSFEDQDIVIMSVGEYEKIIENNSINYRNSNVRGLTSEQLLDQINRDIAIWRADKELDEKWENEMILEDEYDDLVPFDPFSEVDYHPTEWHTAGDILEDKFKNISLTKKENDQNYSSITGEEFLNEGVKNVPFKQEESEINWNENNLVNDEEPVFYEEPV